MSIEIDDGFNKRQYEEHLHDYIYLNKDGHVGGGATSDRVALLKKYLEVGSRIFEIGSGDGTDAIALQHAGYNVTGSDFSDKFLQILKTRKLSAILFDAKRDDLPDGYDAVYANAVFVHFSPADLKLFLEKAKRKLANHNALFLSVIKGAGSERRTVSSGLERDFQYYSEAELRQILADTGYAVRNLRLVDDRWIQVVAQSR